MLVGIKMPACVNTISGRQFAEQFSRVHCEELRRDLYGDRKFPPSPWVPTKNSSPRCWYRCQSTFNEYLSLIIAQYGNWWIFRTVVGMAFGRSCWRILSLPVEAQQQQHYSEMRLHIRISFTFPRESSDVCFHPRGIPAGSERSLPSQSPPVHSSYLETRCERLWSYDRMTL